MVSPVSRLLAFAALAVVLHGVPAYAQTGRITGTVRDPDGAGVLGATVEVTNQATDASRTTTTSADGTYTFSDLAPGVYTVSASLIGIRRTQRDVQVAAGETVTVDFELGPVVLDEIIVTAMLREQELADVPFSIAAPTGDVLRARGAEDIEAVAANVAGFSVQNLGPGQSQVAMRGASSGQIARDQPGVKEQVGAYLDDAAISLSLYTPDLDLFDVSRVEVLRGPQGTLFGSGSLSGTVRYITNQPELGVYSVFGEVGANWIDGGDPGNSAKIGANVPLGDKAAFRVAGYSSRIGGYMDAVQPNLDVNENVNGGDRTGVRAAFRIVPNERFSITPRVVYQRVKMDGWNRIDDYNILANPFTTTRPAVNLGERELFTQIGEPFTDDFLLTDLNLEYNFGPASLTSVTSYTYRDILVVRDAGALTSSITGGSLGLSEPIYTLDSPLDDATISKVFTQEVRLSGSNEWLQWLVGGFYSNNKREYGQSLIVFGFDEMAAPELGAPPGFTEGLQAQEDELFFSDLNYDLEQFAVFGEATVTPVEQLRLTGGLRYYNFDENRDQIFDGIFGNDGTGDSLVSQPGSTDADGLAPRFIASYQATEDLTLNAQASRGFRLGGINDPLNVPLCTPEDLEIFSPLETWEDETAWNYEVGAKSRLLGGRASLNVSAFYMDISDLQLTVTAGTCSSRKVLNVESARSQGVELEVTANPTDNFDFSVAAAFNDSELRSTFLDGAGNVVSGIEEGNRLPSVPEIQVTAAATYQWPVSRGTRAFVTGTYHHIGSRFTEIGDHRPGIGTVDLTAFEPNTLGGPLTETTFTFDPLLPAYNLVNLRVGLLRGNWEAAIFANNVTDERAFLALDRERGTLARVGYLTNQPRTFGVSLRFHY
ncbi:MAG: TonB-dependent receptor [Gemmatimonadetes bacterium]|uniref:TonB-dependent receptor n=1 Tax=Candidatus Kutchimonas denitrificans TaxID=3056748 RepID=A0AAE4ZCL3_9BACT|nr:TonB-dependent receptor [Gemmatimonadota bacterium]NIR76061.1 TonB-dependent receptor [Candidatus Kutchimonas denitrificans]NIS00440.1 TonB-dependent receptor [Gemmatimonadota bacterium]NIT66098.1 TonB-dependent receptor [Gemmatimonadota bacterium]NIU54176.1 TonB-dependent receptor [Gemmatimonadota bacterium]